MWAEVISFTIQTQTYATLFCVNPSEGILFTSTVIYKRTIDYKIKLLVVLDMNCGIILLYLWALNHVGAVPRMWFNLYASLLRPFLEMSFPLG